MGEVMGEGGSTRDGLPGSSDGLGRGRMEKKKEEDGKCDGVDMIIIFFFSGVMICFQFCKISMQDDSTFVIS